MGDVFILNVSIILVSGFIAGCVCKYFKISPLIGYLLVGALIGPGGLDLTGAKTLRSEIESEEQLVKLEEAAAQRARDPNRQTNVESDPEDEPEAPSDGELLASADDQADATDADATFASNGAAIMASNDLEESQDELRALIKEACASEEAIDAIAEFGCLFLLFAIGIAFTFDKLAATAKYMFVGGLIQMVATILVTLGVCTAFHMSWQAGLAIGSVVALSSTALVYRSMADVGQADTKRAQATLGLLIFQDVALVPLLLVLPRVLGASDGAEANLWISNPWVDMALKSATFCAIVLVLKNANIRFIIPRLANFQANDMVVLYAIVVLVGMCLVAALLGLTPALGALAAGIALGENRLTHQIDALMTPFREAFSAMFFISLDMLTDFAHVVHHPVVCLVTLVVALTFKAICASAALRACGMDFRGALAYGTSISQIGELAFMILAMASAVIDEEVYDTILFVSVASLVLTPN
ncbi:MAG: cation:proton antiporter, partial [Thermoguttaceae bacterium]|nr:cation:proton antiporter [Thermoguttaceae bacterium]